MPATRITFKFSIGDEVFIPALKTHGTVTGLKRIRAENEYHVSHCGWWRESDLIEFWHPCRHMHRTTDLS